MMHEFGPTYIYNKYVNKQQEYCMKLGLKPTSCVYFGLDLDNKFPEYNRGREHNRLCFSRLWDGRMTYEPPI